MSSPATLQQCNTRSGSQFVRLGKQLHHFRHRIAKNDPRRPTSARLSVRNTTSCDGLTRLGTAAPDAEGFVAAPTVRDEPIAANEVVAANRLGPTARRPCGRGIPHLPDVRLQPSPL